MLITMAERCTGSSHIKQSKPLQDYAAVTSDRLKSYAYALVADGHGGDKYIRSAKGAELAVRCAVNSINGILKEILRDVTKKKINLVEKNLKLICIKTSLFWKDAVIADYKANPLTEEEKKFCESENIELPAADEDIPVFYGSTLLAAVYLEHLDFWFAIQIGDGKCAVIKNDGSIIFPEELENEKLGFGVTTSLCNKDAANEFRYAYGFEKIAGITVMSDGLADSFDTEKLPDFLCNVRNNIIVDFEKTVTELKSFLPKLSEQGSGDDVSIAGIFSKRKIN
ncbi:MAG: protein phosphatase 2C domain-containing protein [Treponema sp.]